MSKTKIASAFALILMFAMTISLVVSPNASAQENTFKTYAYIGAMPNPVGVGQDVLLHVGITHQLASALYGWEGLTVTVTRPDGHTETLGPFKTDSTGGTGTVYVPTMTGNYTLQTHFPEQENPEFTSRLGIPEGATMLASDSDKLTLVVQEEQITYYPGHALPTEYWTRPIDSQLREWNVIAGNWLDGSRRNAQFITGNDDAPETAHVLWSKQETQGGLVGDPLGEHSFEIGDAYEGKWASRLILGGKLYYNKYAGPSVGNVDIYAEYVCVDMHTGEELWSKTFLDNLTLAFGQLMYWDTYDYHGTYDYLWATVGNTWYAFDAFSGDWVYTLTGVPSGTRVYGPKGEFLIYNINTRGGYMTLWNSTNIPELYGSTYYLSMAWGQWRPYGKTVNATGPDNVMINPEGLTYTGGEPYTSPDTPLGLNGYQWNVSISDDLPGSVQAVKYGDRAVGQSITLSSVTTWGISLEPCKEGQFLFKKTWSAPSEWALGNVSVSATARSLEEENKISVLWVKETRKLYGFSFETGDFLWITDEPQNYLNIYSTDTLIGYGKVYSTGVSGIVYCYDAQSGDLLWTYEATDPYSEILWANQWWMRTLFITDGKIYYGHAEHSPIDPRPRGAPFICLNTTTGEEIWRADGLIRQTHWGGIAIIGDSIIATQDTYTQRIFGIGKGPSATTVSAPEDVQPLGKSVLVHGTVMDISPGTDEYALTARFPDGVPAVSDADMSNWMLYVYKQFERPADIMGVEVIVSVIDPNNNCYEVGRTTSDADGGFKLMFTPEVPGEYTVIATFSGSKAYWPSHSQTYLGVEEALAATPEPTSQPSSAADLYFLPISVGMIIAIVIVLALLILLFRKR